MFESSTPQNATQLNISANTLNALRMIAARQNISLSEALQQAVNVSQLLVDAEGDADTHILLQKGNQVQELKLLPGNRH